MDRRSFFQIVLPATLPIVAGSCCNHQAEPVYHTSESEAFGTNISISITGVSPRESERLLEKAINETLRLESIFTLFDPESPLRRLNRHGTLTNPPTELVEVLRISDHVHQQSQGAFDPTVQPLWDLYENHFARNPGTAIGPDSAALETTHNLIGWNKVKVDEHQITLQQQGMALTLNGIAPGYTADHIATWLTQRGVKHALIDTGEFRAIGSRPDGTPWPVGIRVADEVVQEVGLRDRGLATSSGSGTVFDFEGRFHHLFHPQKNQFANSLRTICVEAPSAALADAFATAGGVLPTDALRKIISAEPDVQVRVF